MIARDEDNHSIRMPLPYMKEGRAIDTPASLEAEIRQAAPEEQFPDHRREEHEDDEVIELKQASKRRKGKRLVITLRQTLISIGGNGRNGIGVGHLPDERCIGVLIWSKKTTDPARSHQRMKCGIKSPGAL